MKKYNNEKIKISPTINRNFKKFIIYFWVTYRKKIGPKRADTKRRQKIYFCQGTLNLLLV